MDKKEQIINEYLIGGFSFRSLGKKHGISRSTINRWVLEYQGFICTTKSSKESIILLEMNKKPIEVLPTNIVELQKQLEQERLHNKLLTAMIDIAEEELKIPIRKKYGTKPLKK
jgi:transposase-like protein